MSSWYSGVTTWLTDYVADPVAEVVGYTDEIIDAYDETGAIGMTAGEKLVGDITDFADSDAFGFIKK